MSSKDEFTVERFYDHLTQGRLMGAKCDNCGRLFVPPRPICSTCFSQRLRWKRIRRRGKITTYSEVYVSNDDFQKIVPYVVAIVQLEDGVRLGGVVRRVTRREIKIGDRVVLGIDRKRSKAWPHWPRYYFTKA